MSHLGLFDAICTAFRFVSYETYRAIIGLAVVVVVVETSKILQRTPTANTCGKWTDERIIIHSSEHFTNGLCLNMTISLFMHNIEPHF